MCSELSGQTPKTSISSGLPSSPIPSIASPEEESELLQLALALLLKVTLSFASIFSRTFQLQSFLAIYGTHFSSRELIVFSLLAQYLANPESNAEESLKRTKQERSHRESSVSISVFDHVFNTQIFFLSSWQIEPEMRPTVLSQIPALHHDPPSLRTNPVFHVFLDHIYPVSAPPPTCGGW